jgi:hypothetical protein
MPPVLGSQGDTGRDFEYEFAAATSQIPSEYDFESEGSKLESTNADKFNKFEFKSVPPILDVYTLADIGVVSPIVDELVQLEAEMGSFGFEVEDGGHDEHGSRGTKEAVMLLLQGV